MANPIDVIKSSKVAMAGLAGGVVGLALMAYAAISAPPSRTSLRTVEGTVTKGEQITRTRARRGQSATVTGVDFRITVQPAAAGTQPIVLQMPSTMVTRAQIEGIIQQRVKAEYDGESDVWTLASGNRELITYEKTLQSRLTDMDKWAQLGKYLLGIFVPILIVGWFLGSRKVNRLAAGA
jgi:hypothetical protein